MRQHVSHHRYNARQDPVEGTHKHTPDILAPAMFLLFNAKEERARRRLRESRVLKKI